MNHKFLILTVRGENNSEMPLMVNFDHVLYIENAGNGTRIYATWHRHGFPAKQTMQDILEMLENNKTNVVEKEPPQKNANRTEESDNRG